MDAFALNGAVVNGWGSLASIVLLPTSTVTVEMECAERIAVSMEGSIGLSMAPAGDISRIANLGGAPTSFGMDMTGTASTVTLGPYGVSTTSFDSTGSLLRIGAMSGDVSTAFDSAGTLHCIKLLDAQALDFAVNATGDILLTGRMVGETGFSLSPSGNMGAFVLSYMTGDTGFSLGPSGDLSVGLRSYMTGSQTGFGLDAVGSLRLTGGLFANSPMGFDLTGDLNVGLRTNIPAATSYVSMDLGGGLTNTLRLSGSLDSSTDPSGTVSAMRLISGTANVALDATGALANNATGYDLESVLMTRPESQREMTR